MKTIQDLITFFEGIPTDNWCVNTYEKVVGLDDEGKEIFQRCALGHLNHHLCGNAVPDFSRGDIIGAYGPCATLIESLSLVPLAFIKCNNGVLQFTGSGSDPKTRILAFLNSNIKEAA